MKKITAPIPFAGSQLRQFGGYELIDIMRTHPTVIIGCMLQQNPFYVPPLEFLKEFRQRRSRRRGAPAAA